MKPVSIGICGLGTVGTGVVNVLRRNGPEIARRAGRGIAITHLGMRSPKPHIDPLGARVSAEVLDVARDPDVDILVELIGGEDAARELVLAAIDTGKHVVTGNKALIAVHGNEIFRAAHKKGVTVAFEASVAGGIPVIKALREGLAANRVQWVAGIINGTGNYILTTMREQGRSFEDALAEAQGLGYAEADPTFDVAGVDAAHKLTILASVAFGIPLSFDRVFVEGITGITVEDVRYADELGYRIKHLGIARRAPAGIELRVHPALVRASELLANVDGVMNAVVIEADALGKSLYYGAGAGADPTASAVIADLVDVVRALTVDPHNRVPHLAFQPEALSSDPVLAIDEVMSAYYLRMRAVDRPGVLAQIAEVLARCDISIEALVQKEVLADAEDVPIIMLTQRVQEAKLNRAIGGIERLPTVTGRITRIRVENLA